MLVLFAVLLVDYEEWFCSLLGSLPSARRAIVCILFLPEQSQVVDWVVDEVLLCLAWEPNASNFEFSLRRRNASPRPFCHRALCLYLSTRWLTTKFCTIRWRTIVQVSLGGVRASSDGSFSASLSPGTTFFAVDYTGFPVGIALRTFLFGRIFANLYGSSPEGRIPCAGGSRTSQSTSWPCSLVLYPAARLQKEVLQKLCNPRCCYRFPRNSSNRLMIPKMILRLGFVDLVDRIASSLWVQLVALSGLSEPSGRAPPVFSYIPLSQC